LELRCGSAVVDPQAGKDARFENALGIGPDLTAAPKVEPVELLFRDADD
jgi:hypothetical protein